MIEISHVKKFDVGSRRATFTIKIPKWGNFLIREVSLFQTGNQRWISFPSRSYEADGKKKYFSFNGFEDLKMMQAFQHKVIEEFDRIENEKVSNVDESNEAIPF